VIAPELRRIIEFLNGQMTQTDVLAIEVKQYTDEAGEQQTIVPRVIGDTADARATKKTPSRRPLDPRTPHDRDAGDQRRHENGRSGAVWLLAIG
jgi:hypothetical protein